VSTAAAKSGVVERISAHLIARLLRELDFANERRD
jgi:hypothetical protein